MRLVVAVAAFAAACSARSGGTPTGDAAIDAPHDAKPPIDARSCTGGDGHATDGSGNCFVFFLGPKTWLEASAACVAMTAHLARIDSVAQNAVIEGLAHGHVAFIGANDRQTEGTFVWDDGTPVTYNNFRSGVPDNGGGTYQEDCLVIEGNKTPDDTWDDRPCDPSEVPTSGSFAYLCEY